MPRPFYRGSTGTVPTIPPSIPATNEQVLRWLVEFYRANSTSNCTERDEEEACRLFERVLGERPTVSTLKWYEYVFGEGIIVTAAQVWRVHCEERVTLRTCYSTYLKDSNGRFARRDGDFQAVSCPMETWCSPSIEGEF